MPYEKTFKSYPYKALICNCEKPTMKSYSYHLIGNEVPRMLPGTSFLCECGGYIDRVIDLPEDVKKEIDDFWSHPEDW